MAWLMFPLKISSILTIAQKPTTHVRILSDIYHFDPDSNALVALCPNGDEVFVWFTAPGYCSFSWGCQIFHGPYHQSTTNDSMVCPNVRFTAQAYIHLT